MLVHRSIFWRVLLTLIAVILSGCGATPTPEVVVVTATPTPVVVVVTATPASAEASATEPPSIEPSAVPPNPAEPTPTQPASLPGGLDNAKKATIRIVAKGSFISLEEGQLLNVAGQGSGFIIDPSGIAVTNNHVVTGAAFFDVWVGDEKEPREATLLGASECSDLAVIDIEGDGPYPYLEWYKAPIETGLEVRALGFPTFGNEELTVNGGIISKARANGQTSTSFVDSIIEHDATINPGNSGGPLVALKDGTVIGVNYAGNSEKRQYFAIARDEAEPVVNELRQGRDKDSIGINGEAFILEMEGGKLFSGIWVSSVKSGSPADKAGLKGGDIIYELEGLRMAEDGTLADYCKTISNRPEATFSVTVFRTQPDPKNWTCLAGKINGEEKLQPVDCKSLSLIPQNSDIANASDKPSSPPAGGGGGMCSLSLGSGSQSGSIGPGGNQWCVFSSGDNKEAIMVAFLKNAEKVELFLYDQKVIPDGRPPKEPDQLPNFGAGTEQGNRDNNDKTKEVIWTGPIERGTKYYVRLVNRGPNPVQFCLAPRDAYSCP